MHRVKGLEFEHMFIANVNKGSLPLKYIFNGIESEAEINRLKIAERSLLYVAATRAKNSLTISSYGTASEFLR